MLSRLDSSVRQYKDKLIASKKLAQKKKEAQVVFKQPQQKKISKPLPKKPKPKKKQKPKEKKQIIPKFTSGAPALRAQHIVPEVQKPMPTKPQPVKTSQPITVKTKPIEPEPKKSEKSGKKILKKEPVLRKKPKTTTFMQRTQKLQQKKPVTSKQEQKKVTLADISKGFMEFARKEGAIKNSNSNHLVHVTGKNIGQATAEQLRHERYVKKLFDCIDVSFKFLGRQFRFAQRPNTDSLRIFVLIDLNKAGRIVSFKIVESSGDNQFDLFMKKVFKDAARSFPPVPTYFNTSIYSLPIQCNIPVATLR